MALEMPWPQFPESRTPYDPTSDWVSPGRGDMLFQGYFDQGSE